MFPLEAPLILPQLKACLIFSLAQRQHPSFQQFVPFLPAAALPPHPSSVGLCRALLPLKTDLLHLPEHFEKDCSLVQMFAVLSLELFWWWLYETVMCWWKWICVCSSGWQELLAGHIPNGIATGQWDLPKTKKLPEFRVWLSHQLPLYFLCFIDLILFSQCLILCIRSLHLF